MTAPDPRTIGVYLLDVGQGDATIVLPPTGEGSPVVFDCRDDVVVEKLLTQWKATEIGALVISHLDWDHIAGARQLLENKRFPVRTVFLNVDRDVTGKHRKAAEARALLEAAKRGQASQRWNLSPTLRDHRSVANGSGWSIDLLAPPFGLKIDEELEGKRYDPNCLSGVLRVRFGTHSVLVGADAPLKTWAEMPAADLPANVFRVPHHGGRVEDGGRPTGWDEARLYKAVSPKTAIVSVGTQNRHDHPIEECIEPVTRGRCRLMCTQVTDRCQPGVKANAAPHLADALNNAALVEPEWRHSVDRRRGRRRFEVPCAGTIVVTLYPDQPPRVVPIATAHDDTIDLWGKPLCRPEP